MTPEERVALIERLRHEARNLGPGLDGSPAEPASALLNEAADVLAQQASPTDPERERLAGWCDRYGATFDPTREIATNLRAIAAMLRQ